MFPWAVFQESNKKNEFYTKDLGYPLDLIQPGCWSPTATLDNVFNRMSAEDCAPITLIENTLKKASL